MPKKSGTELLEAVASAINGEAHPFPTPWPYHYVTVEMAPGVKLLVTVDDQLTVTEVPERHLVDHVVQWLRLQMNPDWFLTVRRAAEAVDMFIAISSPIPLQDVKMVRWATERGYTWHRLPWDPHGGETPTWDGLLAKMTNGLPFRAWLGSLFFEEAKQHQYVWCHGLGGDGKGAINRFLERVFGRSYRSKQPPGMNNNFWTYGLIGARLVVFPDCNSQAFTASGLFKSLSGGDPVDVEAKHKMSFTTRLDCKFLFFSNEKPVISSEAADMRRIIYCEFRDRPDAETPGFEDALWREGGPFLTSCLEAYMSLCPDHRRIPSDAGDIGDIVSIHEERFELLFEQKFRLPHQDYRRTSGLTNLTAVQIDLVTMKPEVFHAVVQEALPEKRDQAEFRKWLERRHGVQKRSIRYPGTETPTKRYVGIHLKSQKPATAVHGARISAGIDSVDM